MPKLKDIYDSLVESGDLPPHYEGIWKKDKKLFILEYSQNNTVFDEFEDLGFDDNY